MPKKSKSKKLSKKLKHKHNHDNHFSNPLLYPSEIPNSPSGHRSNHAHSRAFYKSSKHGASHDPNSIPRKSSLRLPTRSQSNPNKQSSSLVRVKPLYPHNSYSSDSSLDSEWYLLERNERHLQNMSRSSRFERYQQEHYYQNEYWGVQVSKKVKKSMSQAVPTDVSYFPNFSFLEFLSLNQSHGISPLSISRLSPPAIRKSRTLASPRTAPIPRTIQRTLFQLPLPTVQQLLFP